MKLLLISCILSVFLGTAAAARTGHVRDICGTGGTVLHSTTLGYKGSEVTMKTTTCPNLAAITSGSTNNLTDVSNKKKRQIVSQCSDGGCTVECLDLGEQPFVEDCQTLADALEDLFPQSFLAPAQTSTEFYYDSCAFAFLNYDVVEYSVCYINFGFNGIITADDCFGDWPATTATAGGICYSPGYADDDYIIEVFYP